MSPMLRSVFSLKPLPSIWRYRARFVFFIAVLIVAVSVLAPRGDRAVSVAIGVDEIRKEGDKLLADVLITNLSGSIISVREALSITVLTAKGWTNYMSCTKPDRYILKKASVQLFTVQLPPDAVRF